MVTDSNQRIKICQIITRLDWGGAPDVARILCEGLAARGYEVVLVSGPVAKPSRRTQEFLAKKTVRHIVIPSLQRDIHPVRDLAALVHLWRICRREHFSFVHTHTAKAGALGRLAARLAGVKKVIHTPHGHNFYGYFSPWFSRMLILVERVLANLTTRILVLTRAEKNDYLAYHAAPLKKVAVIGTALEEIVSVPSVRRRMREELGCAKDTILVGMVGRLEAVKGPELFLAAARRVAVVQPEARFVIIGEGSMRSALEQTCREGELNGRVFFMGWREDARQWLAGLDVLVLPSRNEAVGLVLLEAQIQGVPVVATRVGGIPDVVRDGVTGFLVSSGNTAALAAAIRWLTADRALRQRLGKEGKRFVQEKFGVNAFVQRVIGEYVL